MPDGWTMSDSPAYGPLKNSIWKFAESVRSTTNPSDWPTRTRAPILKETPRYFFVYSNSGVLRGAPSRRTLMPISLRSGHASLTCTQWRYRALDRLRARRVVSPQSVPFTEHANALNFGIWSFTPPPVP